jgi:hypothetical protein
MTGLRRRLLSIAVLAVVSLVGVTAQSTDTVYVTESGTKYHTASCRSLAKSKIAVALTEAVVKYSPCKICRPPVVASTGLVSATRVPSHAHVPSSAEAESGRCQV